ncbi:MAG TPA: PKD domain-containing protein, partial [Saprospiraceae bacterium]|nr:PKD domain-containing protein [Saprospiraceae bacterium]
SAQVVETIHPPVATGHANYVNKKGMTIENHHAPVALNPMNVASQPQWDLSLSQHGINHGSDIPKNQMDSIKLAGRLLRKDHPEFMVSTGNEHEATSGRRDFTPQLGANFKGNAYNFWAPPDNSMAVSDDGYIVSVINSNILFTDVNGQVLMEQNFDDFMNVLNLHGLYFDPRVIYDPVEDKFIMVVLNGNTPGTSTIVVAFSTTSKPTDQWWLYTFEGDPQNRGLWLDYPSIGISTNDLYISGNQFTADDNFNSAFVYVIKKGPGYVAANLTGTSFSDIKDAHGALDFTIMPVSFGFDGSTGPGIYFISTDGSGGTEAMLYYTDNDSDHNPSMPVYAVTIPNYYAPFNGIMLGTNDELKTNDCKTQAGYYANGYIHFAFDTRGDDFHTKLYYCRLNAADLTQNSIQIGLQPYEYAFPSLAPFTNDINDKTSLLCFLRTSGTIYPEFRAIVCDNDLNISNSIMVKAGTSYTDFDAGNKERWGDYTGISRRNNPDHPEVWIAGCYGADNDNGNFHVLSTWIGQITNNAVAQAPEAQFTASATTVQAGQPVTFTDQTLHTPTSWAWSLPGADPANSDQQNPTVTYANPGVYDVTLTAYNAIGTDTEIKMGYITVTTGAQIPQADFTSNVTSIPSGGNVKFQDLSTNTPASWQWFFDGGTPTTSVQQNPEVTYTDPGCYDVTLIASNAAGNDVITKTCYVDVAATAVSDPDEIFNRFILYPNPVTDGRINIEFEIAHATEL